MKIKTIVYKLTTDNLLNFDRQVNQKLAEGWILGKRDVLPGAGLGNTCYFAPHLYAELVWLDEPEKMPEPQPLVPVEALRAVQEFCDANKCEGCQLYDFCTRHLPNNEGPADWELPGEEAPEV